MKRDSLRWRIQVWHGALLTGTVLTLSTLFFLHERSLRIERSGLVLSQTVSGLVPRYLIPAPHMYRPRSGEGPRRMENGRLHPPPRPRHPQNAQNQDPSARPKPPNTDEIDAQLPLSPQNRPRPHLNATRAPRTHQELLSDPNFYYIAWNRSGELVQQSDNAPQGLALPVDSPFPGETYVRVREGAQEAVHHAPASGAIIVGIRMEHLQASLNKFAFQLFGGSAALILVGLGIGWWMLGKETAQLSEISKSAQQIAHGDLSERIKLANPSREVDDLADVLNNSFARLERSFEQQVRFTADASHELRTPVSVILTKGQHALSKNRPAAAYRDAIATSIDSATHMKRMIESLLELSRYDSGEAALNLQNHDLSLVVQECVELLQALAEKKRIKLTTTLENANVRIDPHRFQQVCINLVSNAIKHSPFRTEINVTITKEGENCLLVVADEGHGIDEDELPFLFDRFYKGKQTNGSEKESSGLGLAITKAIVLAHGGTIQASNRVNGGALLRISIPIANNESERKSDSPETSQPKLQTASV